MDHEDEPGPSIKDEPIAEDAPRQKKKKESKVASSWTKQEDVHLRAQVEERGPFRWDKIAAAIPGRPSKSCRLRWINHLAEGIRTGPFTPEEDAIVIGAQAQMGNKWTLIAKMLNGRSDNSVKNRWNSALKKLEVRDGGSLQPHPSSQLVHSSGSAQHSHETCAHGSLVSPPTGPTMPTLEQCFTASLAEALSLHAGDVPPGATPPPGSQLGLPVYQQALAASMQLGEQTIRQQLENDAVAASVSTPAVASTMPVQMSLPFISLRPRMTVVEAEAALAEVSDPEKKALSSSALVGVWAGCGTAETEAAFALATNPENKGSSQSQQVVLLPAPPTVAASSSLVAGAAPPVMLGLPDLRYSCSTPPISSLELIHSSAAAVARPGTCMPLGAMGGPATMLATAYQDSQYIDSLSLFTGSLGIPVLLQAQQKPEHSGSMYPARSPMLKEPSSLSVLCDMMNDHPVDLAAEEEMQSPLCEQHLGEKRPQQLEGQALESDEAKEKHRKLRHQSAGTPAAASEMTSLQLAASGKGSGADLNGTARHECGEGGANFSSRTSLMFPGLGSSLSLAWPSAGNLEAPIFDLSSAIAASMAGVPYSHTSGQAFGLPASPMLMSPPTSQCQPKLLSGQVVGLPPSPMLRSPPTSQCEPKLASNSWMSSRLQMDPNPNADCGNAVNHAAAAADASLDNTLQVRELAQGLHSQGRISRVCLDLLVKGGDEALSLLLTLGTRTLMSAFAQRGAPQDPPTLPFAGMVPTLAPLASEAGPYPGLMQGLERAHHRGSFLVGSSDFALKDCMSSDLADLCDWVDDKPGLPPAL